MLTFRNPQSLIGTQVPKGLDGTPVPRQKKLFIGGITPNTDEDMLKTYFSQWGPVCQLYVNG